MSIKTYPIDGSDPDEPFRVEKKNPLKDGEMNRLEDIVITGKDYMEECNRLEAEVERLQSNLDEWAKENMLLYPNPNNGNFTLEVPEALIGKDLYIYDMQGRLLDQLELLTKVNYIEFIHFARGAYWLQIDNEVPLKLTITVFPRLMICSAMNAHLQFSFV